MEQITVKQMHAALAREIKKGNGDKMLITGNDNEGNGYHGVFFTITDADDIKTFLISDSITNDVSKLMIIG